MEISSTPHTKIAFISGINGQTGSFLCELLLEKGYIVHGLIRRCSQITTQRLDGVFQEKHTINKRLFLHYGDMSDSSRLTNLLREIEPDEVYNLAAMSHVKVSFDNPEYTGDIDALGVTRLLEVCRKLPKRPKFYQASTSEMFGGLDIEDFNSGKKLNELSPFTPKSPYAIAKLYSYNMTNLYRESYDMFCVNGILFNHTSPRRGDTFVEKKIVKGLVNIKKGKQSCLYLGNIYACRDIGHAKDYSRGIWLMLNQSKPDNYVLAMGSMISVKDIVNEVCKILGMEIKWSGSGEDEQGIWVRDAEGDDSKKVIVKIDPSYFRPCEVDYLCGDSAKARFELGWEPKYTIQSILEEMIMNEM